jgi:hypothetical protein
VGQERLLVLSLFGLGGTPARSGRQVRDGDGDEQVGDQRHPVFGVGEAEGVERRQLEEVQRQHAEDRGTDCVRETPGHGDGDDRQQVDGAEGDGGCDPLEQLDDPGRGADGRQRQEDADAVTHERAPHAAQSTRRARRAGCAT